MRSRVETVDQRLTKYESHGSEQSVWQERENDRSAEHT